MVAINKEVMATGIYEVETRNMLNISNASNRIPHNNGLSGPKFHGGKKAGAGC